MAAIEDLVPMSSGDLLQDWSSDSISSHNIMIQVKSPAMKKNNCSWHGASDFTLITSFFSTWYVTQYVLTHKKS